MGMGGNGNVKSHSRTSLVYGDVTLAVQWIYYAGVTDPCVFRWCVFRL